jgi:hypothetical protein
VDHERRADTLPITCDPLPKSCHAWVRFGPPPMQVERRFVVGKELACAIEFVVREKEFRCWVWANAATAMNKTDYFMITDHGRSCDPAVTAGRIHADLAIG